MEAVIKKGFFVLSMLLFFLTGLLMSAGIWVSPGDVRIKFVPNGVYEGKVMFGGGRVTQHLKVTASGDFDIIVDKEDIWESGETVKYKVIMPASFDRPGVHGGSIRALETPEEELKGFINILTEIVFPIYIDVPYPGKYLELKSFEATNKEAGETIPFTAIFISKGDQVINSAIGHISIYDKDDKRIGSITTNTKEDIQPGDEIKLYSTWDSGGYKQGNYHAGIIVNYDELKTNASTKFKLGGLDVNLMNYTREVFLGGIRPFYLIVDSIWSENILNMKASVSILDNNSDDITSFETLTKNLPAWGQVTLGGYLDTQPLSLGTYDIKITLFFEDLSKEYDGLINITEEPVEEAEKKPRITTIKIIMITLIILVLIMLGILAYVLIPKKKKAK